MDKTSLLVKEMLGTGAIGTFIETTGPIVDAFGGVVSPVGAVINGFKMDKLKKRLDKVEPELLKIKNKIEKKENDLFYKQEVFPLILKYLTEEDEDGKVNIFINGFEYTVDEGINEMEKLYHYFDVLAELRISDIVYFFDNFVERDLPENLELNIPDFKKLNEDEAYRDEFHERADLRTYMSNKLVRLGLIASEPKQPEISKKIVRLIEKPHSGSRRSDFEVNTSPLIITKFGRRFVKFFGEENE